MATEKTIGDEIDKVIFKGGGTRLKESMGLATPEESKPVKQNEQEKEYWRKVRSSDEVSQTKNVTYEKVFEVFLQFAKQLCRTPFILDNENEDLVKVLCLYFSKDKRFENYKFDDKIVNGETIPNPVSIINNGNPDLEKGIMIFGNYGFGKTFTMKVFKAMNIPGSRFSFHRANDIVMEYSKDGYAGLEKFLKGNCYYDDIGTEDKASHYEKGKELFKTIIEYRYDQFLDHGKKTYLSSNLDPDEIAERYGDRIESRIHEMFNIIVVNGTDRRKQ